MQHKASVFAALFVAGCAVGSQPGFSGGDHWAFPLVVPLEDGVVIADSLVFGFDREQGISTLST